MATEHNITRRSLVAGLGAAIPATAVAAVPALAGTDPAGTVSPRLAALYREHQAAHATRVALQLKDRTDEQNDAWEEALDEENEIARAVMAEPVASMADFTLKLAVWDATVRDDADDDDDMTECAGWGDRALPRLFNDARALLGCPAAAA